MASLLSGAMALISLIVLMLGLNGCHGIGRGTSRLSMAARKKQPSIFSKPAAMKNFPRWDEDAYECVDIYEQPAFNNPLLKNHKIQMVPSFSTKSMENKALSVGRVSNIGIQNEGCPSGTVPISKRRLDITDFHQLTQTQFGQHFATIQTKSSGTYYGARAIMNLLNPPVKMDQYSMALIWVQNGPAAELNSIQVGWGVHPRVYGDNNTYLTTFWTADGYKKTGCYDSSCPGFVQIHSTIFPGALLEPTSVNEEQLNADLSVILDQGTGNWWFLEKGTQVGYWPKELFTHLVNGASYVRYGGNTFNSPDGISPPMGNGNFPSAQYDEKAGHFAQIQIADNPERKLVDVQSSEMELFVDNDQCYKLNDLGFVGELQHAFGYGGPGGNCGL